MKKSDGNGSGSGSGSGSGNGRFTGGVIQKPKGAPRHGPGLVVRFRSKAELKDIKRAARDKGLSANTYILTVALAEARNYLAYRG